MLAVLTVTLSKLDHVKYMFATLSAYICIYIFKSSITWVPHKNIIGMHFPLLLYNGYTASARDWVFQCESKKLRWSWGGSAWVGASIRVLAVVYTSRFDCPSWRAVYLVSMTAWQHVRVYHCQKCKDTDFVLLGNVRYIFVIPTQMFYYGSLWRLKLWLK